MSKEALEEERGERDDENLVLIMKDSLSLSVPISSLRITEELVDREGERETERERAYKASGKPLGRWRFHSKATSALVSQYTTQCGVDWARAIQYNSYRKPLILLNIANYILFPIHIAIPGN